MSARSRVGSAGDQAERPAVGRNEAFGIVQRDREPLSLHLRLEPLEIVANHGCGVGLDDGGRCPLVLPPLARHTVGERDRHPFELLAHDLFDAQLVLGIEEAEEERNRDGAEAFAARSFGGGTNGRLVERHALLTAPVEPSRDLDDVRERHERSRLAVVEVVEPGSIAASDVVDVACTFGREQQHLLAAALQERVQADGRPMHREGDRCRRVDHLPEPGEDSIGQVVRRCRRLAGGIGPAILVVGHDIGERPPDIH